MGREYRMVEIHTTGVIERSAADVFAYVADYRRMNEWVFGITSVRPVGDADYGPGAVFEGGVDLGPKTLSSTAEIQGWQQDHLIALRSLAGFDFTATLRLQPGEIVKSCGSRVVRRPRTLGCRAMVPG